MSTTLKYPLSREEANTMLTTLFPDAPKMRVNTSSISHYVSDFNKVVEMYPDLARRHEVQAIAPDVSKRGAPIAIGSREFLVILIGIIGVQKGFFTSREEGITAALSQFNPMEQYLGAVADAANLRIDFAVLGAS